MSLNHSLTLNCANKHKSGTVRSNTTTLSFSGRQGGALFFSVSVTASGVFKKNARYQLHRMYFSLYEKIVQVDLPCKVYSHLDCDN